MKKLSCNLLITLFFVFFLAPGLHGETITNTSQNEMVSIAPYALLNSLLNNNEKIKAYHHRIKSAKGLLERSKGHYYPALDLYGNIAQEKIEKEFGNDTNEFAHDTTLKMTQLITDFGRTTNIISRDEIFLKRAQTEFDSIKQQVILDGISAYITIVRARERLETAQRSANRIKELTGIEKALVKKGAGLTSNVLQAKSQLAGANALIVEARWELNMAKNHFQAIFYHLLAPSEIQEFIDIGFPESRMPDTLESAIEIALKNYPEITMTRYDLDLSKKEVAIAKSAYFPSLSFFAEAVNSNDNDGTLGYRREYSAGIQFKYNLFNGGSDKGTIKSAVSSKIAASSQFEHAKKQVIEQIWKIC